MFELDPSLHLPVHHSAPASQLVIFRAVPTWHVSPSAAYNETVLNQVFNETAEFIDTTSRLSGTQLRWLAFMEQWLEPDIYKDLDKALEKTIGANVNALSDTMAMMAKAGFPVKIDHLDNGERSTIVGIGYSTEIAGYQVGIQEGEPDTPTLVPLLTSQQLSF